MLPFFFSSIAQRRIIAQPARESFYHKGFKMSFNISKLAVTDTTTLQLVNPATEVKLYADEAETLPLEIVMYGKSSKQYRAALSALSRKGLARKGKPQTFETNVEDNVEILVAISKKANNFDLNGAPIDNPEAFRELYSDNSLFWIKDQVQAELENVEAFLQK